MEKSSDSDEGIVSDQSCEFEQKRTKVRKSRDFVEISYVTYRKLDELKIVTQPFKIIRRLDPFETQIERCE